MTVFGLEWNQDADTFTRLEGASGWATPAAATAALNGVGPWDMRRCNLWDDGTVTAYYGDRCYTDTDVANMGQAMVKIPKFWYTTDHTATTDYKWYISTTGEAGTEPAGHDHDWRVHPAFIRNGVTKPYIYLGAYEGYFNAVDSKLESKSGVAPTATKTLSAFRTSAQLRKGAPNYWECQDYLSTCAVQLLYLIEYAEFDSQGRLGQGLTNTTLQNTGLTTANGNASYGVTGDGTHAMSYRGIENFYGNIFKLIDGINIKADYMPWIADHNFVSCITGDTSTGFDGTVYVDSKLVCANADGVPNDIATESTVPGDYGFLASTISASGNFLHDYYYRNTGNRQAGFGGGWAYATLAGMFSWFNNFIAGNSAATYGARLMYIG